MGGQEGRCEMDVGSGLALNVNQCVANVPCLPACLLGCNLTYNSWPPLLGKGRRGEERKGNNALTFTMTRPFMICVLCNS